MANFVPLCPCVAFVPSSVPLFSGIASSSPASMTIEFCLWSWMLIIFEFEQTITAWLGCDGCSCQSRWSFSWQILGYPFLLGQFTFAVSATTAIATERGEPAASLKF